LSYELVIIGGGPAGLSAGIYASRLGLKTIILEKGVAGGLISEAPLVENYPGFPAVNGMKLAEKLREHAIKNVEIAEFEPVRKIERNKDFKVYTDNKCITCKAVILATGTRKRKLGVPGEKELKGKGVSYCAVCDGPFFKGCRVAVVGGGNSAALEALYLAEIGCKVVLIHRRKQLRAEKILQDRLKEKGVKLLVPAVITEIIGRNSVEAVKINKLDLNVEEKVDVEAVFIAIGEDPNSELASEIGVKTDSRGYVIVDRTQRTNIERFYAAGDVTGGFRQVVTACAEGAIAAFSAYEDIKQPYWRSTT